ncbi:MAG TPA: DUF2332 domain-containing protein [Solirubrobacterales bacterium]|nr:DUF2332 domain-containing protein [Solirubrobacterales bacterium]
MSGAEREAVAERLRWQARECARLGSGLYAGLLGEAADDVDAGGVVWEVLRGQREEPTFSALPLRLMGAVNRLVLAGEEAEAFAGWEAFRDVMARRRDELRELVDLPVQTNEVGRSCALLFGFLAVAAKWALPLRTLELGASAGLNSNWDRYRYEVPEFAWGPNSPLRLADWRLLHPIDAKGANYAGSVVVAAREACDSAPVDASTEEGRRTLLAYVWADQRSRVERLTAALEVAREHPVAVERARAAAWAAERLAAPAKGVATVVFHSVFAWYMPAEERDELLATIVAAGDRATAAAPLAWLRLEGPGELAELRLTTWPGGEERHLGRAGYHGDPVELLESPL